MTYGKIRIEEGNLIFSRHMLTNVLPCSDILWAYMRRAGNVHSGDRKLVTHSLVIRTRRNKKYNFEMSLREVEECLTLLKALNPKMAVGYPMGNRIPLQSMPNTRDLGALYTRDGRQIIPGKLIRSGNLYHISQADQDTLRDTYHLKTVIDLRLEPERNLKPDETIAGVSCFSVPLVDDVESVITHGHPIPQVLKEFDGNPDTFMMEKYSHMVGDEICASRFAKFINIIRKENDGTILWHCTQGKDRTGVATAILLELLGVERDVIMEDFMKSNSCLEAEMEYMTRLMESRIVVDVRVMDNLRFMYRVKEQYLQAVYDTIDSKYGSMAEFQKKILLLTPKLIEEMRSFFLM